MWEKHSDAVEEKTDEIADARKRGGVEASGKKKLLSVWKKKRQKEMDASIDQLETDVSVLYESFE